MQYGKFWRRAVAFLIDSIILYVGAVVLLGNLLFGFAPRGPDPLAGGMGLPLLQSALTGTIYWLYFALLESSSRGATVGKMLLGIRVVDTYGERVSFWRATGRHFGRLLSTATLFVGYLMAAFTTRRQALHDMIAGTLVIKA